MHVDCKSLRRWRSEKTTKMKVIRLSDVPVTFLMMKHLNLSDRMFKGGHTHAEPARGSCPDNYHPLRTM